ncbi:MAG: GerMN domain-containing protein [Acidobacteriota bacterium]
MAIGVRFVAGTIVVAALVGASSWALVTYVVRPRDAATTDTEGAPAEGRAETPARRITATLHYVAEDGLRLVSVTREVPFGATTAEQAERILEAQLEPPPERLLSAIPSGTTLRGVFVSHTGQAFVDFGPELRSRHPGGSLNEIFTVYCIVSTLTTNLPALRSVQILIDGREADTLAGHVDLRRPLPPSREWLEPPAPQTAARNEP